MEKAIGETNRRRGIQVAYNKKHGITPKTILKQIKDITEQMQSKHEKALGVELQADMVAVGEKGTKGFAKLIKMKEREMNRAVKDLDFETAAILRDEIIFLKNKMEE